MTHRNAIDAREIEAQAASLLVSLKGIEHARVECDAHGRIARVEIAPAGIDDRAAMRNAQSALMAVFGQAVDVNAIAIAPKAGAQAVAAVREIAQPQPEGVLELKIPPVKQGELNVAAKVAFETLRAAQASFNGFQFDGAEQVRINGVEYIVVALKHGGSDVRFCGAAQVVDSVSTASARALMSAVGKAAIDGSALDMNVVGADVRALKA